jgi:C-terminal processing protease CtpA/Prc
MTPVTILCTARVKTFPGWNPSVRKLAVMKVFAFGLLVLSTSLHAQEKSFDPDRKYHPDSLKSWTIDVMEELGKKHPGFYWYTTKPEFDAIIDSTVQTITDSLNEFAYYRKLKPLFAQVGCVHTSVSLSKEYERHLDKTFLLMPLELFVDDQKKVFVAKVYSTGKEIQPGAEVVSIDGVPIITVVNTLYNAIPADGFNEVEKKLLLSHKFAFWYQTILQCSNTFNVETIMNGAREVHTLQGVAKNVFPSDADLESADIPQLKFEIRRQTGILTIHSFAKTTINRNHQNFKRFIKDTFKEIRKSEVKNLILDLRYNTGGTDGNAALLASYFFDKTFRYWDRIEVTEAIAKEIKGVHRLFYRNPVKRDSTYQWWKTWVTNEFNYYEPQKPARNNFGGRTYLITNGLCLSSCSDLVAVLSSNGRTEVIGQETGGGFQGNTSGMTPKVTIPTGLVIAVPLQKYTNAVDLTKNFGRGTIPDHIVTPTLDNWIRKADPELELALRLVGSD